MNHEREHEHDLQHDPLVRANDAAVPGRASRSAAMSAPAQPMVSGLLMRKASGGDVDANAEQAVGRAGASSGHGLPDGLREKFEGSIGTDLSAVRVHTGGESQQAAAAVGARAYAVGNDIHFGAGEYDPQSSSGQHLIAHEVAHTVQQRGGTPTRQNKLAVSHASDAFEVAADRAADAMVVGAPTSLGGANVGIARKEEPAAAPAPSMAQSLSIQKGPLTVDISVTSDGKVTISGGLTFSGHVATPIPGVFVEGEVSAKTSGEGALGADGGVSLGVTGDLTGQVTLNGGIPKVASIYGGGALSIKLGGITAKRSPTGSWSVEVNNTISLVGKLVLGAKAEALDALKGSLPPGWDPAYKYEINPGGEQELLVLNLATSKFSQGKDLARLINQLDGALIYAGLKKGAKLEKSGIGNLKKLLDEKKEAADRKIREEQNAKDRKEYDQANNPKYENSGGPRTPFEEMDKCE